MNVPSNLKYSKSDEWVLVEGNLITIGVTDFAQDQLSDVVFWEPTVDVDDRVKKGDAIATLESVKAAADVNAPAGGVIVEMNVKLEETPELVNSSPYKEAWMIKIEVDDLSDLDNLMDADSYTRYCEDRGH